MLKRFRLGSAKSRLRAFVRESARQGVDPRLEELEREIQELRHQLVRIEGEAKWADRLEQVWEAVSADFDDITGLRRELARARHGVEYEEAFSTAEPLVSVRIATYGEPTLLIERAIASVLAQTYQHFEIVVVGDFGSPDTEKRVLAIGDSRIRYADLPVRAPYPDDPRRRWLVAGSPAMNFGLAMTKGLWVAPLDHDDEFLSDHIEVLLNEARTRGLELAYGKARAMFPDERPDVEIGEFPPRMSQFGFQAAIHLSALRFFEYNAKAWLFDEPGDWNLCRRMLESGVRMGFVDRVVTLIYPSWSAGSATEPRAN